MNAAELCHLIQEGRLDDIMESDICTVDGYLSIKDKIPLPVLRDCSLARGVDYEVQDEAGVIIGVLTCTSDLNPVDLRQLSEWQLAAYLFERELNEYDQPGRFRYDYVVISSLHFTRYQQRMKPSSAVWGMFTHVECAPAARLARSMTLITALEGMKIPTPYHASTLERAVQASHPFERYLKYYHQLELVFDWILVKKVQCLGSDLQGMARLISSYQSGDLPRLKNLLASYCKDAQKVHSLLMLAVNHKPTAHKIFQEYSKEGNPLSKGSKWDKMFDNLASSYSPSHASSNNLGSNIDSYNSLIIEIAAYWIFRVRCCIAHHRIGEYLLVQEDEEFVLEFSETLLRGVLMIILADADFCAFA
jgi:hypothetical protein